jgi:hypothetical protein
MTDEGVFYNLFYTPYIINIPAAQNPDFQADFDQHSDIPTPRNPPDPAVTIYRERYTMVPGLQGTSRLVAQLQRRYLHH